MATKVALRNPEEQLSDHEWTKKWTLPSNGRSPRMNSSDFRSQPPEVRDGLRFIGSNFETPVILLRVQARTFRQEKYLLAERVCTFAVARLVFSDHR